MNTKINYLYRDANNFHFYNECIIYGPITEEQKAAILNSLHEGQYFVPGVVDMPEERFGSISEDDDVWFELGEYSFEETCQAPTLHITADELVVRFQDAAKYGKWDAAAEAFNRTYFPDNAGPIVTAEKYAKLRQCLLDNGIPEDEADTVTQAVCYIVSGEETEQFMEV